MNVKKILSNFILAFSIITALLLISFLLLGIISCTPINQYFGLEDDNLVEEMSEEVLRSQTGIDMDFTPGSPE